VVKPVARTRLEVRHTPPTSFRRAHPLLIEMATSSEGISVRLCYRHTNQAEGWTVEEMKLEDGRYRAEVPATYTDSPFPLQYYFEWRRGAMAGLHPGFDATWSGPPYFVVRQA